MELFQEQLFCNMFTTLQSIEKEYAELKELLRGFRPRTEAQAASYDTLLEQLLQKTKLWHLYCNKNPDAAAVAFVQKIRDELKKEGVEAANMKKVLGK